MKKVIVLTLTLVALTFAEEQKAEGRQMNWNNLNFATKPGYSQNYQQSSYGSDSSDIGGSPAIQNAQAKSSGSYQGLVSQSLDGQDINRDGSYSAPSNYGSNNDYGYEASPDTSYGNAVGYGDDKHSNFVSALTAFLPIGLFLAAIVPNIVTVSAGRRKRSEAGTKEEVKEAVDEATFPILDMISSFGVRSLQEPSCQSKIVCEIGRMGGLPEANVVQQALWFTANYVPERLSNLIGADKLFRQIRSQQCSEFMCSSD